MKRFNDTFLKAARREKVDHTPVWYMRQAGRTFPEYLKLRERYSVLEISKTPELAAEVTVAPVAYYGVDAAVMFADIMIPLQPIGVDLDLVENVGPVIQNPITSLTDIKKLKEIDPDSDLPHLKPFIEILLQRLPVPIIGFCGAPFTLASYLIEGKPTREFVKTKSFIYRDPKAWHLLMDTLTTVMIVYLKAQIRYGVHSVQIFDSWAGYLNVHDYEEYVLPYSKRLFNELNGQKIPRIHFGTNTNHFLKQFSSVDCEVVSIDWRNSMSVASKIVGRKKALQGNLDPVVLLSDWSIIKREVDRIFDGVGDHPGFIFNLGHGILPETKLETVKRLTKYVQEKKQ